MEVDGAAALDDEASEAAGALAVAGAAVVVSAMVEYGEQQGVMPRSARIQPECLRDSYRLRA